MSAPKPQILYAILAQVTAYLIAPQLLLAAEDTGSKWGAWLTIGRFFNLALVIGVLVWVMRKPLAAFFANRTQSIREQLEEARKAKEEAEAKLAEMGQRMSNLEAELGALKASADKEAEEEYQRLVAAAEKDSDKVIERARQEIEGMTRAAQIALKQHVAELAVQLAEEKIRSEMNSEDKDRLFARFIEQLRHGK